jgi:hypothetical protein
MNLTIRYWDRNMPGAALKEAHRAVDVLESLNLPVGCAGHNVRVIRDVMSRTKLGEDDLMKQLKIQKSSIDVNYRLGLVYFDRRMFTRSGECFHAVRSLLESREKIEFARVSTAQLRRRDLEADRGTRHFSAVSSGAVDESRLEAVRGRVGEVLDDLAHLDELNRVYCRLSREAPILPCLLSRFSPDVAPCEDWWREIRMNDEILW